MLCHILGKTIDSDCFNRSFSIKCVGLWGVDGGSLSREAVLVLEEEEEEEAVDPGLGFTLVGPPPLAGALVSIGAGFVHILGEFIKRIDLLIIFVFRQDFLISLVCPSFVITLKK